MIFVSVFNKRDNVCFANKVSLRIKEKEPFQKVAEEFFRSWCEMEKYVPAFFYYKIYVTDGEFFFELCNPEKR